MTALFVYSCVFNIELINKNDKYNSKIINMYFWNLPFNMKD